MKDNCCCINKIQCDCDILHADAVNNVKNTIINDETILKLCNMYKILSDNTRLKICLALEIEKLCVCDIANVLNMTKSAVSHQLKVLRENNLVTFSKVGKNSYYELADEHVKQIIDITLEHVNHS